MINTSCKIYLDNRAVTGEEAPLKIMVVHNRKSFLISTGIKCSPKDFDKVSMKIVRGYNAKTKNLIISQKLIDAQKVILDLEEAKKLHDISTKELKKIIECEFNNVDFQKNGSFIQFFKQVIERKNKRTAEIYAATLKRIKDYCDDDLTFEDINISWLTSFQKYLKNIGNETNTIAIHLRNIRAVINSAIDEELTTNYPFRKFKIKATETRKRSLSVDKLREIITLELKGSEAYHRDMLVLSFLLIGINSADLYNLDKIINGRIEYDRAKTGRHYSIKVEPEAMELINKYKGKKRLIDIADKYYCVESFTSKNAKVLKNIRSGLSSYWARHTWATIAYSIGISTDVIAQSLGHSNGLKVTNIYINPSLDLVDNANRKVIDFVYKN